MSPWQAEGSLEKPNGRWRGCELAATVQKPGLTLVFVFGQEFFRHLVPSVVSSWQATYPGRGLLKCTEVRLLVLARGASHPTGCLRT